MLNQAQFDRLFPRARGDWLGPLNAAMREAGITTELRIEHFLAQIGHESAGLTVFEENLNYDAAGLARVWPHRFRGADGRPNADAVRLGGLPRDRRAREIGDVVYRASGGWMYRGRGPIQLTGERNYAAAGRALGINLHGDPDIALLPEHGARIAGWFWSNAGLNRCADDDDLMGVTRGINACADRDDLVRVTRSVNGGLNGLADREAWLARARVVIDGADPDQVAAEPPASGTPSGYLGPALAAGTSAGGILSVSFLREIRAFIYEDPIFAFCLALVALGLTSGFWWWRRWQSKRAQRWGRR